MLSVKQNDVFGWEGATRFRDRSRETGNPELTYMSIRAEIRCRMLENRLSLFEQVMPVLPDKREIFLAPEIKQAIDGTRRKSAARRFGQARAFMEIFLKGDLIIARWPPDKDINCLLAFMASAEEGVSHVEQNVWEFRIGDPKPGLRIFGRFAAKDIFIGTHLYLREHLPKGDKWPDEIALCKKAWKGLFPVHPPLSGNSIHDFISNARLPP